MYNGDTCRFLRSLARTLAIPPLVVELSLPDLRTCWVCHYWGSNTLPSSPHDRQKIYHCVCRVVMYKSILIQLHKIHDICDHIAHSVLILKVYGSILYLFKWIDSKRKFREDLSTAHLFLEEKKFNLKVKSLSVINNWYLHLRYLFFLILNYMKCSRSKPKIRYTLQALITLS